MKYRLKVRPEAEVDLAQARQWYNEQRRGLGGQFLAAVRQTHQAHPAQPTVVRRGVR